MVDADTPVMAFVSDASAQFKNRARNALFHPDSALYISAQLFNKAKNTLHHPDGAPFNSVKTRK